LTLGWDGPASYVCDATLHTTNRVHGYTTRGLVYYLRFGEQLEIPS
jgi:hypothetical protein